jgi:hypothetical protein
MSRILSSGCPGLTPGNQFSVRDSFVEDIDYVYIILPEEDKQYRVQCGEGRRVFCLAYCCLDFEAAISGFNVIGCPLLISNVRKSH